MPSVLRGPNLTPVTKKVDMMPDDDHTLCSETSSICSDSNNSASSFVSHDAYDELPPFRLPKNEGDKAVYEAWTVFVSKGFDEPISTTKLYGIISHREFDSYSDRVMAVPGKYEQQELADMYLTAINKFNSKRKSTWPARLLCSIPTTYEDDIDLSIRKLPELVQEEITRLLVDRENASSNRMHNRDYNVVLLQERLDRRFAGSEPKVIGKRHRVRFWKYPGKKDRSEYFIILRGREGKPITDPKGQCVFKRHENPWHYADEAEARRNTREEARKVREKWAKAYPRTSSWYDPPRSSPPLPTTFSVGDGMRGTSDRYTRPSGPCPRPRSDMPYVADPDGPPTPRGPTEAPYVRAAHMPPPRAPTPPASYPTPPGVRNLRASASCLGAPTYPCMASAPYPPPPPPTSQPAYPPPSAPRLTTIPLPPPGFSSQSPRGFPSGPQPFGSLNMPYTMTHCGGPYNGLQTHHSVSYGPPATLYPAAPIAPPQPSTYHGVERKVDDGDGSSVSSASGKLTKTALSFLYELEPSTDNGQHGNQGYTRQRTVEEEGYEAHLCGGDDESETGSVRSWMWRTRDQVVDCGAVDGEKRLEEKGSADAGRDTTQAELERKMEALIEANKRRNEERKAKARAETAGGKTSL